MMQEKLPSFETVVGNRLFRVADYQRPYAWEHKQLEDLWEDLNLLGERTDHYTGTLVLKDADESPIYTTTGRELTVFEIVDGQQRLTTLTILAERLRRALLALGSPESLEAARTLDDLLRVRVEGTTQRRLELANELDEFFERCIMSDLPATSDGLLSGERRLAEASAYFDSRLQALGDGATVEEAFERLMRVRKRVTNRLKFLVYEVENAAEVGILFETLNDRGRDLTELEKVKNYLLYLARQLSHAQMDRLSRAINATWADIYANLARAQRDDDTLLRAHWLVTQSSNERSWRRASSVKAKFPRSRYVQASERLDGPERAVEPESSAPDGTLFDEVTKYIESLRMASIYMRDVYIKFPELPGVSDPHLNAEILARTAALRRSGKVAHFLPILIATRLRYPNDAAKYLEALDLAERFSGRVFAVAGIRSNAGRSTVTWAANGLYRDEWDFAHALDLLRKKALQLVPDSDLQQKFAQDQHWYGRPGLKYVLYEYELEGVRAGEDTIGWEAVSGAGGDKTIEHVLPQIPRADSQWLRDFPDSESRARYCHGIGNLVLTRDNGSYGNRDYLDGVDAEGRQVLGKKGESGRQTPCYVNSTALFREREIAEHYQRWTGAEIDHRRAAIATWALERWHIKAPVEPVEDAILDEEDAPAVPDDE